MSFTAWEMKALFILGTTHPSDEVWVGDLSVQFVFIALWGGSVLSSLALIITFAIKRKVNGLGITLAVCCILFSLFPFYTAAVQHHIDYETNISFAEEGLATYPSHWWEWIHYFYLPMLPGALYLCIACFGKTLGRN